jgi:hypothetical protein
MMTGMPDGCAEAFGPYRRLAFRVLMRALRDLAGPTESSTDRESARAFLAGSGMLLYWCRVAALDPSWIVSQAGKLSGLGPPTSASSTAITAALTMARQPEATARTEIRRRPHSAR